MGVDESGSFEFDEFCRLIVCMKCVAQLYAYCNAQKHDAPQLIYSHAFCVQSVSIFEFVKIFNLLARRQSIWILDVLLKVQSSTDWLPVLDQYKALNHSIQTENIAMICLLASYNYRDKGSDNDIEFRMSAIECVLNQKYKLCLV